MPRSKPQERHGVPAIYPKRKALMTAPADIAASGTITGLPAMLIILVVVALIITGAIAVVRAIVRKGKEKL
jgi:hypothetical protein